MSELGDALDAVNEALHKCAVLALNHETREKVAAEEMRLGQIALQVQLILSFLDIYKQSKSHKPNLRIVK